MKIYHKLEKKKLSKIQQINYVQLNEEHSMLDMREYLVQRIIPHNMSYYRAYVNGYHWIKNEFTDNETRNLGYYSPVQTSIASYFRGSIIDYLNIKKNQKILEENKAYINIRKTENFVKNYIIKIISENNTITGGYIEYLILSIINHIPIVIYNDNNNIIKVFDDGEDIQLNDKNINKFKNNKSMINIRLTYLSNQESTNMKEPPFTIQTLYFI